MTAPDDIRAAIREEREAEERVLRLIDALAESVVPLWNRGDGCGGWVLAELLAACARRGLPTAPVRRAPSAPKRLVDAIPPRLRDIVLARDGAVCRWCGSTEDLTIDHIVPRILGGPTDPTNLQVLCRACNSSKGATKP